jgi:hypothetical protein
MAHVTRHASGATQDVTLDAFIGTVRQSEAIRQIFLSIGLKDQLARDVGRRFDEEDPTGLGGVDADVLKNILKWSVAVLKLANPL